MRSLYRRALRYGYVLDPDNYRDHVHNAWLYYFDKTSGSNLFDEPAPYVFRAVKLMWYREICKNKTSRNGNHYHRQFVDIEDFPQISESNPEHWVINKEFLERVYTSVGSYKQAKKGRREPVTANVLLTFLNYLERGYENHQICDMMKISPQTYHNYIKKLRSLLDHLKAPFNGSRVTFPKKNRITRKVYDSHPGKYSDFIYDPVNYDCDKNEFYVLLVSPETKEYLLIVEK